MEVIIVDPDRGNRAKFSRNMAALGCDHRELRVADHRLGGVPYKGRILNYRRGAT